VLGTLLVWISFDSGLLSFNCGLHSFDSGLLPGLSQTYTTMGRKALTAIELLKGATAKGYQVGAHREKDTIREGPRYIYQEDC
jgi:hypothetical protein